MSSQIIAAPRVSVVMTVFNAAPFLDEAIESVLSQTVTDFEFLIHDDGSSDESRAIAERWAARDPRIAVSSGPNRGISASANALLARAQAPLIARFDADDVCLPERFERQIARFEEEEDLVLLGTGWITMDEAGRRIAPLRAPTGHDSLDARLIAGITPVHQPTCMFRRAALERTGPYDEDLTVSEDLDLFMRLAEVGRIDNIEEPLVLYRVHDRSISARKTHLHVESVRRVCERAWARRGIQGEVRFKPFRPDESRASRLAYTLTHGWQAWRAGYRDTWRHFAGEALRLGPFSPAAWKLAVLGYLRRP
ncbi:MAG: glycosyltransferase [Pseudomonadota bacterium]